MSVTIKCDTIVIVPQDIKTQSGSEVSIDDALLSIARESQSSADTSPQFSGPAAVQLSGPAEAEQIHTQLPPEKPEDRDPGDREEISMLWFVGHLILFMIPVIGWIVCIMYAFIEKSRTKLNFIRAMLIMIIIQAALIVVAYFVISWAISTALDYLTDYLTEYFSVMLQELFRDAIGIDLSEFTPQEFFELDFDEVFKFLNQGN